MLTAVHLTDKNIVGVAKTAGILPSDLQTRVNLLRFFGAKKTLYAVLNDREGSWGWQVMYEETFRYTYEFVETEFENVLCEVRTK